jgi:CRISPR/Cas system-associated exonuclease Cas4 (RecB family)
MNKQMIKLSPSTISLFMECPRCFWLQFNKNIHRPRGIFPSLPGGMDGVIKKYYDSYRKLGKLPPEVDGKLTGKLLADEKLLKSWQSNWEGIKYFNKDLSALMKGVLDDCLVDGGTYIPLDYKTRGYDLKDDSTSYYQHQLDIYCYLLAKNGYNITNYAYLVYYFPKAVKENGQVEFNVEPKKVETDIKHAEQLFKDAVACLRGPEPKKHTDCSREFCNWGFEAFGD